LFIDVNIGNGRKPRIILYEGDQPEEVATEFSKKYCKLLNHVYYLLKRSDEQMRLRLIMMLKE